MSTIRIAAATEYDAGAGSLSADEVIRLLYRTIHGICQSIDGLEPVVLAYTEVDHPGPEVRLLILEVKPPNQEETPEP